MSKFFNTDDTKATMDDTYIPRENRKAIKESDFSNFDMKNKKK